MRNHWWPHELVDDEPEDGIAGAVLAFVDEEPEPDDEPDPLYCVSCAELATGLDSIGRPMCAACFSAGAFPDGTVSPAPACCIVCQGPRRMYATCGRAECVVALAARQGGR